MFVNENESKEQNVTKVLLVFGKLLYMFNKKFLNNSTNELIKKLLELILEYIEISEGKQNNSKLNRIICVLLKNESTKEKVLSREDIEIIEIGGSNLVLRIGKYVLKIGVDFEKNDIIYDKKIILPLIILETNPKEIDGKLNPEFNLDGLNLSAQIEYFEDNKWFLGKSEDEIEEILYSV